MSSFDNCDATCQNQAIFAKIRFELLYFLYIKLSFDTLFMFLGYIINTKLWVSVNAIVLDFCKHTEPRKKQLKVQILHKLKEF